MTDCDDNNHISVFDFGGVKKKSKKGFVIIEHGIGGGGILEGVNVFDVFEEKEVDGAW